MRVSQLRAWTPHALVGVASDVTGINDEFDDCLSQVARRTDDALADWQGDAAAAALARSLADRIAAGHVVTAVAAVGESFSKAAGELGAVRDPALTVVDSAVSSGFTVDDAGAVVAPVCSTGDIVLDVLMQSSFDEQARTFEARLLPLLDAAAQADRACAAALQNALDDLTGLSSSAAVYCPEVRAILDGNAYLPDSPTALADFWDGLSPAEKDGLAAWDPTIGNRDGLPAIDKSRYNEQLLETLRDDAHAKLDNTEARHPDWMNGENLPPTEGILSDADSADQRELNRWLDERAAAEKVASGYDQVRTQLDTDHPPRLLLNIDDEGRGAIALRNPDTAGHVATYVPGTSSGLHSLGGDMARAETLLDAVDVQNGGPNSVVTWVGYSAPPELPDAASAVFADAGAPRLDSFQDGLRAAHDGSPSVNTVIGHSYGSTVIGHAMSGGNSLDADNIVFAGSPGVGHGVNGVDDLRLDHVDPASNGGRIFATAAASDPVTWIGDGVDGLTAAAPVLTLPFVELGHGADPTNSDFGATVFDSHPGPTLDVGFADIGFSPSTHSNYFADGNPSLRDMARIVAGTR